MIEGADAARAGRMAEERRFPPVIPIAIASMMLIVIDGIYMAAHLPRHAPLGPALALLAGAVGLLVADVATLVRVRPFAWGTFFTVVRWALLAYVVIAGMLEYVFVLDHVSGTQLVILTLMLTVFALDVPLILAFSVARYQEPGPAKD